MLILSSNNNNINLQHIGINGANYNSKNAYKNNLKIETLLLTADRTIGNLFYFLIK